VRRTYVAFSELPPWMVLAALPLTAFLTALGAEAGKEAFQRLKKLVKDIHAARSASKLPPGNILLEDNSTHIQIVLSLNLPDEAYEKLLQLDPSAFRQGPIHYDTERRRWYSTMDEMIERQEHRKGNEEEPE
jgi:hypothetical protein